MNKEYTIRDLYEIYCEAMPRYPLAYERFRDILHKDNSQIFTAESSKTIIGFVVVNGNSVVILCVKKEYRHSGYGKHLLIMAEGFISANYDEVILGGSGLLQGVPCDNDEESSVPFFEKRGYSADFISVNMGLELNDKAVEKLKEIPRPNGVTYRFADDNDREKLLAAVKDAQAEWLPVFEENSDAPVLPVQIRFATIASASRMATPDCTRMSFFFALGIFRTANITMSASTRTTPNAIR